MARANSDSSSSSSSTNESWLYEYLSPVMIDFIESNPSIDYKESIIAEMPPAMQKALESYGSGAAIDAGKSLVQKGGGLMSDSIAWMQGALSGGTKAAFSNGVSGIMSAMNPYMETQAAAIQDSVYSDMAATFGQTAQSTMSNGAVSGSSSATQTQAAVMSSGANAMTQMIADMQTDVLGGAIGLTTDALSAAMGLNQNLLQTGKGIAGAGGDLISSGTKNMFNAGLVQFAYDQANLDNNRQNDMINSNLEWIDMAALMAVTMPGAGLKTSSDTNTETESQKGWF